MLLQKFYVICNYFATSRQNINGKTFPKFHFLNIKEKFILSANNVDVWVDSKSALSAVVLSLRKFYIRRKK